MTEETPKKRRRRKKSRKKKAPTPKAPPKKPGRPKKPPPVEPPPPKRPRGRPRSKKPKPKKLFPRPPFERSMKTYEAFVANDKNRGYDFWLFHGVNLLSGNPFPGIYRGDQIYRGAIYSHIMEKHFVDGKLTPRGIECLVWAGSKPKELYRSAVYTKTFAHKYKRDPRAENDVYVRVAVEAIARIRAESTDGWGSEEPVNPVAYFSYGRTHRKLYTKASAAVLSLDPRTRVGWEFWAQLHRETIARYGLPKNVEPFRLDYQPRKDRGYLLWTGKLEGAPLKCNRELTESERADVVRRAYVKDVVGS